MRRGLPLVALLVLTACSHAPGGTAPAAGASAPAPGRWRTADQQAMSRVAVARRDATCRQLLRPSVPGGRLRLRLSAAGAPALPLAAVTVAQQAAGPAVVPGSLRAVTVGGQRSFTLPAGGVVVTDPVAFDVRAGGDVAVSLAFRGTVRPAEHAFGVATGWCSADGTGDLSAHTAGTGLLPAGRDALVVEALEVETAEGAPAGVVAVGDSLTDPPTRPDLHLRWTDRLAERLQGRVAVANAAIGGNRVLLPGGYGDPLVARFRRDVLDRPGVGTVVLLAGTNDVSAGLPAAALLQRLEDLRRQARAAGVRVVLGTLPPAERRPEALEQVRLAVNAGVRRSTPPGDLLDADALLRDPARPRRLLPAHDSGDALHLSVEGHRVLGDAVAGLVAAAGAPGTD